MPAPKNINLVERALALLTERQRYVPATDRSYSHAAILAAAQEIAPGTRLHRCSLSSNLEIAALIAEVKGKDLPPAIDFLEYSQWTPPRRESPRQKCNRRATLRSTKSIRLLAMDVVGLQELTQHFELRLTAIETARWVSGPWPIGHTYPLQPFTPSALAHAKYAVLVKRPWTKEKLIRRVLELEPLVSELHARLVQFDEAYLEWHCSSRLDGVVVHDSHRSGQRKSRNW